MAAGQKWQLFDQVHIGQGNFQGDVSGPGIGFCVCSGSVAGPCKGSEAICWGS